MRRPIAFPAVIFLLISTAGLPAQQQPTFRSRTELVIVDAVVVDKDGNAVRGLKAADFALTDRKKPRAISTFEEISHTRPANSLRAPALPPAMKLDVASNMTVQADRLVMVFVDDLHIWQGRTDKAKALANDIVSRLGPQASMAMVFSSGEGSTEVTQDRSTLLTAVEGMKARQTFRRPHQGFVKQGPGFIDPAAPAEVRFDAMNEAAKASLKDHNDNLQYLEMLRRAATMLIHEGGRRKAFVAITEGMTADFSSLGGDGSLLSNLGSSDSNLNANTGSPVLRALMDALRKANVTFYAIDPRGKVRAEDMMLESWPPPDCAVCNSPPLQLAPAERARNREDSQFSWENPVRVAQAGLGFMSEAAGGFAVTDTDDLTGGLGRILEDLDHYYLLGFYPSDTSGRNDTHPVGLTVPGHPDYKVRFRRGYTPDAPSPPLKSKDPLAELATGVLPKSDLPLRLTAMPLPDGGNDVSVAVALEVTAPVGLMKESDSKLRDDVSYSVMVVDEKRAKVTQRTGRSARFSLSATDPDKAAPDTVTYQIPLTIDLTPGRYQLRASALSKKLNKGGSVYLEITVPDFAKMPLALTTIALGFADGPRVPVGRTTPPGMPVLIGAGSQTRGAPMSQTVPSTQMGGPASIPPAQARAQNSNNPLPFEPTLSREFVRTDALRTYFEVVRKDPAATVALEIRVLDSNNVPQLQYDRIVAPREKGGVQLRIPLDKLGPGAFTLRITGSDGRNITKTETGFIVK